VSDTIADIAARNKHKRNPAADKVRPGYSMSPRQAVEHADELDLPDGAFFALIEELSGADSGDLPGLLPDVWKAVGL